MSAPRGWLLACAALLASCSKTESGQRAARSEHSEHDTPSSTTDVPLDSLEPAAEVYKPTASEVPLTEDFTAAAVKRVTPDNYRQELTTIEKELAQLQDATR